MPIYEYLCESCGHQMEKIQKMSDDPLKDCPECQKETLRKLVSAAAFKLKGSGWYETDFKDKNKSNSATDGKKTSSENTSTAKPETKSTEKAKPAPKAKKDD